MMGFLLRERQRCARVFFIQCAVYLVAFSRLFWTDFNYADDVRRAAYGYHGWLDFSRYTSTILSNFIHADGYLMDVSPLPQFLAILFLAAAGTILIFLRSIKEETVNENWMIASLSVLPLGLCPYFLGCITYKYDSPYMALSILASVFPFLFLHRRRGAFEAASLIGVLVMCTSFQACSGVYPMVAIFLAADEILAGKKIKETVMMLLRAAAAYVATLLVFALFLMRPGDTGMFPAGEMLSGVIGRYSTWVSLIRSDYKNSWLLLIALLIVAAISVMIAGAAVQKGLAVIITLLAVLFSALIQWGVLPVLQRDAYDPRAMIGFGIWLALLSQTACRPLAHMKAFRVKRLLSLSCRLIPLALIWCFFVYSFAWGNCLSEQKRYTEYRFQLVLSDLVHVKEMKTEDGINGICQRGTIGMSPIVQRNAGRNTLIRRLLGYNIPGLGGEGIAWFRLYYGMSDIPLVKEEDLVGEEIILSAASTHSISRCGDVIIVEWKENDENVTR